jgi:hypothetical protein
MNPAALLSWSFPLGQVGAVAVRLHWTLLLSCLFLAVGAMRQGHWRIVLPMLLVPLVVVAFHALAVWGMARLTRGRLRQATLWGAGTMAELDQPARPLPVFLVALAGPLAMAGLWALLRFAVLPYTGDLWPVVIDGMLSVALVVGLLNLLPHAWFDGGRLWRGVFWRPLGIRRAATTVVILGIVCGVLITGYGLFAINPMALLSGALMIVGSVQERRSLSEGFDPVLNRELALIDGDPGWYGRWAAARAHAAALRQERTEAAEQETLDRLLAKVSEHGLPALTAGERGELQRISAAQRARQGR